MTFKPLHFIVFIFLVIPAIAYGQRENDTWVFSYKGGIKFRNDTSNFENFHLGSVPIYTFADGGHPSCISDHTTGDLLFFSDGNHIWDKNNRVISDFPNAQGYNNSLIIPFPGDSNAYYVFADDDYVVIRKTGNTGIGLTWGTLTNLIYPGRYYKAVKHAYNNSYWLLTAPNNTGGQLWAYNITENGINKTPVISRIGKDTLPLITYNSNVYSIVPSNNGKKILITYYTSDSGVVSQLFNFDKNCGIASPDVVLNRTAGTWNSTYSNCFSPDDSRIYSIGGSFSKSFIIQYSGRGYSIIDTVMKDSFGSNGQIGLGPDNKLYISAAGFKEIDVIEFPDSSATKCGYIHNYFNLNQIPGQNKIFGNFPNLMYDRSVPGVGPDNPGLDIQISDVICVGDSTYFTILPPLLPDSVEWDFGDSLSTDNFSKVYNPSHLYSSKGKYTATVYWYKCNNKIKQTYIVEIKDLKLLTLGSDTFFCYNDSIHLSPGIKGVNYTWSTGSTAPSITINKAGKYWVLVQTSKCSVLDSINIKEIPPVVVDLGGNYTICDDDNELVKLDAGKGYNRYMWTPTGDTTQWIVVKKVGDYFVVVEDYHGCKGDDDAKVLRQCGFTFFIPNSFTPNGDGLNDVFGPTTTDITEYSIEIYNTWGEKIFVSNDPAIGWDGTYKNQTAPIGAYIWRLKFKGFHNKLLKNYNHRGVVNLVR